MASSTMLNFRSQSGDCSPVHEDPEVFHVDDDFKSEFARLVEENEEMLTEINKLRTRNDALQGELREVGELEAENAELRAQLKATEDEHRELLDLRDQAQYSEEKGQSDAQEIADLEEDLAVKYEENKQLQLKVDEYLAQIGKLKLEVEEAKKAPAESSTGTKGAEPVEEKFFSLMQAQLQNALSQVKNVRVERDTSYLDSTVKSLTKKLMVMKTRFSGQEESLKFVDEKLHHEVYCKSAHVAVCDLMVYLCDLQLRHLRCAVAFEKQGNLGQYLDATAAELPDIPPPTPRTARGPS